MTELDDIRCRPEGKQETPSPVFSKGSISFGNNRELGMSLKSWKSDYALSAPELLRIAGASGECRTG